MKYIEKKDGKLVLELESIETQMIAGVLLNSGGGILGGPSKATLDEIIEIETYIRTKPIREALNEKKSIVSLTGRQLLLIRDVIAESLREIASFEFSMRHPGDEQDAANTLFEIKRIQDETKDYGTIPDDVS